MQSWKCDPIQRYIPISLLLGSTPTPTPPGTDVADVTVRIPASLNFFRLSLRNCISCVFNCDVLLYIYLSWILYAILTYWWSSISCFKSSFSIFRYPTPPVNPSSLTISLHRSTSFFRSCISFWNFSFLSFSTLSCSFSDDSSYKE